MLKMVKNDRQREYYYWKYVVVMIFFVKTQINSFSYYLIGKFELFSLMCNIIQYFFTHFYEECQ